MILVEEIIIKSKNIFKMLYENINILFNDNLPTNLYIPNYQVIILERKYKLDT